MVSNKDKIPTWVGRAVATDELSVIELEADGDPQATVLDGTSSATEATVGAASNSHRVADPQVPPNDGNQVGTNDVAASRPSITASIVGVLAATVILIGLAWLVLSGPDNDDPGIATNAQTSAEATEVDSSESASDLSSPNRSTDAGTADLGDEDAATEDSRGSSSSAPTSENETHEDDGLIPNVSGRALEAHRETALADGQSAWAIYSDGRIYLQGTMPNDTLAEALSGRLQELLGSGNVIEQYTIDESAPLPTNPPLFIKETVVFEPGGAAMPPGSDWILVVADVLMTRFPSTDITVVANGADEEQGISDELQLERADAIISYLSDRGIDGSRLDYTFVADGEFGGNTGNKSIEFVVRGLLS